MQFQRNCLTRSRAITFSAQQLSNYGCLEELQLGKAVKCSTSLRCAPGYGCSSICHDIRSGELPARCASGTDTNLTGPVNKVYAAI